MTVPATCGSLSAPLPPLAFPYVPSPAEPCLHSPALSWITTPLSLTRSGRGSVSRIQTCQPWALPSDPTPCPLSQEPGLAPSLV